MTRRARARLAALLLQLAACSSPEERLAAQIERAEQLANRGEAEAAILEYKNALKLEPEDAAVHERIADLHRGQSRFAEALDWYREAFRLDPTRISAAMNEARLLVFQDAKRARELVELGLREAPDLPVVHVTASQLALAQSRTQRALAEAERAVELGPEDPVALVQLGSVHQARIRESQLRKRRPTPEMFESAITAFEQIDRLAGGHPRAQVERARTLAAWGRHEEAVAGYKAAIALALARGNAVDAVAAGEALDAYARERQDHELRRFALRQIVSVKSDEYPAWDKLARLVEGKLGHKGDEVYRELIEQRPDDPQAHVLFVNYLQREGRDAEAVEHLEHTIEETLDDPALWDQILRVRIGQGRYAEARHTLARMLEEHPDDPATRVADARLAIAEGRYDEGIRTLAAVVSARDEFEPLRLLALAHHRRGDAREARAAMDRVLALTPRPPLAVLRLDARIDHATGDWMGVLRNFRIVAGRGEELSPEERILGATALYHTGRRRLGRAILEEILASGDPPPEAALELARLEGPRDPERAHQALLQAQVRHPLSHELLLALTEMEVARGDTATALARLDAIVASSRATPRILLSRAELLRETGALDRAEADALRAFEANPELPGAVDLLFQIYQTQDRLAEVQHSFEQAEEAGVLHPGARMLLARLASASGDTARARELLEQVLRDHPRMREARRDLSLVLAERGEDLERALELARQAEGGDDDPLPDAVDALGFVHLRAGRGAPALAAFQRAIRLAADQPDGREPTYHYHVGLALRALGREAQAIVAFEQALGRGTFPEVESARRELEAARQGVAAAQKAS